MGALENVRAYVTVKIA